jgi:hypothetical protein
VYLAPSRTVEENQIRGGGIGGRLIRAKGVASSVENARPIKRGIEKTLEGGQRRVSVEHETEQQLRGCE